MAQAAGTLEQRMTVTEHLSALRRMLMVSLLAWAATTAVAFGFHDLLLSILLRPVTQILGTGHHLVQSAIFTSPTEGLTIPMKISLIAGFVLALPVIVWQVWVFVSPGLRSVERRFAVPFIAATLILFAVGASFAYFVMPLGLNFLVNFLGGDVQYLPDIDAYLSFLLLLIVVFGLTFELPVVILLLGVLGIVSSSWLRAHRSSVYIGIIAVALVVTPGADPFTPTALGIPLLVLFEASVLILAKVFRR